MANLPNSACFVTEPELVASTANRATWFALTADGDNAGSAIIYDVTSTSSADNTVLRLQAAAGTTTELYGPFFPACGLYVGNTENACVNVWRKK
jgi:hypothetical protein